MCHGNILIQPILFVYEIEDQIYALNVETLNRFSAAVSYKLSAKGHWEKVDAYMSDSVTKTLKLNMVLLKIWDLVTFHIILFANHIPVNDLI